MISLDSTIPILLQTTSNKEVLLTYIPFENPMNHPDVMWVNPESEGITIEMIRTLQGEVLAKPYQAEFRYFILLGVELATIEAQQALLKLLEEPPRHIKFILTTTYPSMVLPTILSRVQIMVPEIVEKSDEKTALAEGEPQRKLLDEVLNFSLGQKLNWAGSTEVQEFPVATVLNYMNELISHFENAPTLKQIQQLRIFEQTITMLRAKTNPRLCLEWLVLHF